MRPARCCGDGSSVAVPGLLLQSAVSALAPGIWRYDADRTVDVDVDDVKVAERNLAVRSSLLGINICDCLVVHPVLPLWVLWALAEPPIEASG